MLTDTPFIQALKGKRQDRPPVWFMRQAGRYLPEYREIRAEYSMLDVIMTPELAKEVTLQPLRRFPFDASIIFADILTPLIGMGIELDFVKGEGPKIFNPLTTGADVAKLKTPPAGENTPYTLKACELVSQEIAKNNTPLIGFSGAPFTLSSYMIEGGGSNKLVGTKSFFLQDPEAWRELQEKLVTLVSEYLVAQANAGCSALQIFDSWVGFLGPTEFNAFVAPYVKEIIKKVRAEVEVPIIYFGTVTSGLFPHFSELGADAYGVDWRLSLQTAEQLIGNPGALQGNLDPVLLANGTPEYLEKEVARILEDGAGLSCPHIFNLGHGILPHTPIENVSTVVNAVKGR